MARYPVLGGPDPVDVHVGGRVRELRQSRGVSQNDLAQAVGITFQQVYKYEIGVNRISASMLYGIARTLSVPISAFFDGLPDTATTTESDDVAADAHIDLVQTHETVDG